MDPIKGCIRRVDFVSRRCFLVSSSSVISWLLGQRLCEDNVHDGAGRTFDFLRVRRSCCCDILTPPTDLAMAFTDVPCR
jgi:hypothetical protein